MISIEFNLKEKKFSFIEERISRGFKFPSKITSFYSSDSEEKYIHLVKKLSLEQQNSLHWFLIDCT